MQSCRVLRGLIVRKESWQLSRRGKLVALLLVFAFLWIFIRNLCLFLSPTDRVPSSYLVVEGWISVPSLRQAATEFTNGGYKKILTSGCRVRNPWHPDEKSTAADWGASKLRRLGFDTNLIEAVPCWTEQQDRTYHSALALKNWLSERKIDCSGINVLTEGPHARRTRLLFQKAFGPKVRIGIIAIKSPDFDCSRWWNSSEGVREVIGEAIAYTYARLLFSSKE